MLVIQIKADEHLERNDTFEFAYSVKVVDLQWEGLLAWSHTANGITVAVSALQNTLFRGLTFIYTIVRLWKKPKYITNIQQEKKNIMYKG